ncbi:MAG: hypothetical protein JSW59_03230 [Phycisphaerales bacterium]|nr:MAG: hypothetical protein JSW59_03230 [Phycisphaerales bacterium]
MKKEDFEKRRKESRLERSGTIGPIFGVLCLTLLPLRLVTSLVGVASAGSASGIAPGSVRSIPAIGIDPNSPLQRQLWRAEIGAAQNRPDETSKNELSRMIERIRSVTFEPKNKVVEPVVLPVKVPPTEPIEPPADATADTKGAEKQEQAAQKPKLPYEPISEKTLQMLRDLSKHPEKVDDPFELGETLFLSRNLAEAAVFYTEALNRTEPNDVDPVGNRAWMLFQAGNCLRNSDMPTAAKMYTLLLTEYPNSTWSQMAQAQVKLIDWYLRDEPQKLIAERKQTSGK